MSFSSVIKNELNKIENARPCCIKAEKRALSFLKGEIPKPPGTSNKCCKRAVLRCAFLMAGSVSDPAKSNHLEIICGTGDGAAYIAGVMGAFGLHPKTICRNEQNSAYIKEGEGIVDFLNIVGAHSALLSYENARILKGMRNSVNRIVNCETANLDKTVNASVRQIRNINYIGEHIGFENLSPGLREIAKLRLENSDISLVELGQLADPPLGKSGVNHRLRRLDEIAKSARSEPCSSEVGNLTNQRSTAS